MQLGIHVGTFPRTSLEATLDAVVEHGLSCVHFNFKALGMLSMPAQIEHSLCDRIARAMSDRGLSIATLSGTFNMIHPDRNVRREGFVRFKQLAAAAKWLNAPVISLCTGTRDPNNMWRGHSENSGEGAFFDLTESLSEALQIAERHDVVLGIEPEVSNVVCSARLGRQLLDQFRTPRLKIILDGANLFHAGQLDEMQAVLDEAFDLLGPEIVVAHAKDLDRDGHAGQLPAGSGRLDYDAYLAGFRRVGFDGPIILHSLKEDDVADCVRMLREKMVTK